MKTKLIMALATAFAISATSCNSDEPSAPMPDNSKDNVVDWGDTPVEAVTFSAKIDGVGPRSRAADSNGFYGSGEHVNTLRYCIYDDDYNVLMTEQNVAPVKTDDGWTLKVNLPVGQEVNYFFWADYNSTYTLNYGECSVKADYSKTLNMLDYADAFSCLGHYKVTADPSSNVAVTMKRPFTQVCVLSRELDATQVKDAYPDYPFASFGYFLSSEPETVYMPTMWYYTFNSCAVTAVDLKSEQNSFITNPNISRTIDTASLTAPQTVTYQGETYKYLYLGYVFAAEPYHVDKNFDSWGMDFYNSKNSKRITNYRSSAMPTMVPNTRLIILSNSDGSSAEGSLLLGSARFLVEKSTPFTNDTNVPW